MTRQTNHYIFSREVYEIYQTGCGEWLIMHSGWRAGTAYQQGEQFLYIFISNTETKHYTNYNVVNGLNRSPQESLV